MVGTGVVLAILGLFFLQSLVAFAIFAGLAKLLNYRVLKDRPVSWRVAGTIGVVLWTLRNIFAYAMDWKIHNRINMNEFWAYVIPALVLLAIVWFVRLLTLPVK